MRGRPPIFRQTRRQTPSRPGLSPATETVAAEPWTLCKQQHRAERERAH